MHTTTLNDMISAQTMRTHRNARPGFSLIELTAVLVILGLLMAGAAIAIPKQIERARVRTTKSSMVTIKTSITTYMADNSGDVPEKLQNLIPNFIEPGSDLDAWDKAYYYLPTPGAVHAFELMSSGPDKTFQTPDDINVWTMDVKTGS